MSTTFRFAHAATRASLSILGFLALTAAGFAARPVNATWRGIAIDGYDPVAYFTDGKPSKGSSDFTFEWKDATWRFASAEHRDMFAADPEKFAPQYGGYCAYAVSEGYTAGIDGDAWRIVDDKLYLNYDLKIREKWEATRDERIKKADANWPEVLKK